MMDLFFLKDSVGKYSESLRRKASRVNFIKKETSDYGHVVSSSNTTPKSIHVLLQFTCKIIGILIAVLMVFYEANPSRWSKVSD